MKKAIASKHVQSFVKVEQSSSTALQQFEMTIEKLRSDNAQLSTLYAEVDSDIQVLEELKERIAKRVSSNDSAIIGLDRVINGN